METLTIGMIVKKCSKTYPKEGCMKQGSGGRVETQNASGAIACGQPGQESGLPNIIEDLVGVA
jgi:hypothetical protein